MCQATHLLTKTALLRVTETDSHRVPTSVFLQNHLATRPQISLPTAKPRITTASPRTLPPAHAQTPTPMPIQTANRAPDLTENVDGVKQTRATTNLRSQTGCNPVGGDRQAPGSDSGSEKRGVRNRFGAYTPPYAREGRCGAALWVWCFPGSSCWRVACGELLADARVWLCWLVARYRLPCLFFLFLLLFFACFLFFLFLVTQRMRGKRGCQSVPVSSQLFLSVLPPLAYPTITNNYQKPDFHGLSFHQLPSTY